MSRQMFLATLLLLACGPQGEDELDGAPSLLDDEAQVEHELGATSPGGRVIVWQQNIEAMKAAKVPARLFTQSML